MELHHPLWNKHSLSVALLGTAVVAFVLMLFKITSYLEASARAENLLRKAMTPDEPAHKDAGEADKASWAVAEQLKKNNLFSPPAPVRNPITSVLGILGSEALIGDKWYRAGDTIADARIVAVEPTHIRVQWQGRETILAPIEIDLQRLSEASQGSRRQFVPPSRSTAPVPTSAPSNQPPRMAPARSSRSERVSEQNKNRQNTEADKKRQLLNEKLQHQKALKQSPKTSKNETAAKKAGTPSVANKKAAVADAKKPSRKSSQRVVR